MMIKKTRRPIHGTESQEVVAILDERDVAASIVELLKDPTMGLRSVTIDDRVATHTYELDSEEGWIEIPVTMCVKVRIDSWDNGKPDGITYRGVELRMPQTLDRVEVELEGVDDSNAFTERVLNEYDVWGLGYSDIVWAVSS